MKHIKTLFSAAAMVAVAGALASCQCKKECKVDAAYTQHEVTKYEPTWSSLSQHRTPQWAIDAKFGIYSHYTAYTVRGQLKEYDMSCQEANEKWTGEKFDAAAWADLFQRAGAQFAGPVAWHVNGIVNWDSKITKYNAVNYGVKQDIAGELAEEVRKRGMKVIASFHSTMLWGHILPGDDVDMPMRTRNDGWYEDARVFGPDGHFTQNYMEGWLARNLEAIDHIKPDMVWVDTNYGHTVGLELQGKMKGGKFLKDTIRINPIRESIQKRHIAYYYNQGLKWGKDVEFIYKSHDIPPVTGMRDWENGVEPAHSFSPWMADINIMHHNYWKSPWFYSKTNKVKDANCLIDMLADIVSKNGRMLLNVPPMIDGTFDERTTKVLQDMGDWLKLNGEAIYNTVPWCIYGEGPSEIKHPGHHGQGKKRGKEMPVYTARDIRFTQQGDNLYAIVLDWPKDGVVHINSLGYNEKCPQGTFATVELLGSSEKLQWEQKPYEMVVTLPKERPCDLAYVLKLTRTK